MFVIPPRMCRKVDFESIKKHGCKKKKTNEKSCVKEFPLYIRDYTFFFNSTDIALASLRKIALPQRSSRKLVNWWYFHLRKAQAASWNSLSVQLLSASNNGLTEMQAIIRQNSQKSQAVGNRVIPIISVKENALYDLITVILSFVMQVNFNVCINV